MAMLKVYVLAHPPAAHKSPPFYNFPKNGGDYSHITENYQRIIPY